MSSLLAFGMMVIGRRWIFMATNFANVNLYPKERWKLFQLRFRQRAPGSFFGASLRLLSLEHKFIKSEYGFVDATPVEDVQETMYTLTDRYFRYRVYRRRQIFDGKVVNAVFAIVTSLITAIITTRLTAAGFRGH